MQKRLWIFSSLFVVIDQIIKCIVSNFIDYNDVIRVIPNFFYLSNVHNEGAAFSLFSGNQLFLIIMTIIALGIIYYFFIYHQELNTFKLLLVSMLFGGIIGNFINRLLFQYVIDYLGFIIFGYYFPIFNFADICIVLSISLLLFLSIKEDLCKSLKLRKKPEE